MEGSHSPRADAWLSESSPTLCISSLVELEVRNRLRNLTLNGDFSEGASRQKQIPFSKGDVFDSTVLGMSGTPVTAPVPAIVTASTPAAANVQSEAAAPEAIPAAVAAAKAAVPGGTVEVKSPAQVAAERQADAPKTETPAVSENGSAAGDETLSGGAAAASLPQLTGTGETSAAPGDTNLPQQTQPLTPEEIVNRAQKSVNDDLDHIVDGNKMVQRTKAAHSALAILRGTAPEIAEGVRIQAKAARCGGRLHC